MNLSYTELFLIYCDLFFSFEYFCQIPWFNETCAEVRYSNNR